MTNLDWVLPYLWDVFLLLISLFFGIIFQEKFDVVGRLQKLWAKIRNESCSFSIITEMVEGESPIESITKDLINAFESRQYVVRVTSEGARDVFEAKNNVTSETFFIDVTHDNPTMIDLKSHHTGINKIIDCLDEWDSTIDGLGGKYKIESISFEIVLPYSLGINIKAPKKMKVEDYQINFLHDNKSRVTAMLNNKVIANSKALSTLRECFKALT